jgi:hypothetical protein
VRQVDEHVRLVTFMHYDLGYFDDATCRLDPIRIPSPRICYRCVRYKPSPMCPEWTSCLVFGRYWTTFGLRRPSVLRLAGRWNAPRMEFCSVRGLDLPDDSARRFRSLAIEADGKATCCSPGPPGSLPSTRKPAALYT